MKNYRDLIVWQKAMSFVTSVYTTTSQFPKEELYGLTSQLRRSAVSIPSNTAEGYGRNSRKDYSRFISIAIGSLYECQTQLEIGLNLGYCSNATFEELFELSRELERMFTSLRNKLDQPKS